MRGDPAGERGGIGDGLVGGVVDRQRLHLRVHVGGVEHRGIVLAAAGGEALGAGDRPLRVVEADGLGGLCRERGIGRELLGVDAEQAADPLDDGEELHRLEEGEQHLGLERPALERLERELERHVAAQRHELL